KYDVAQRLLDSALTLRTNTPEFGLTLIQFGDLKRAEGELNQGLEYYSKAISALGNHPEAAAAAIHIGVASMTPVADLPRAFERFQGGRDLDPKHAGPALMWMAIVRQRQGIMDEAVSLYRASLGIEQSPTTTLLFSQLLDRLGREDEARQLR